MLTSPVASKVPAAAALARSNLGTTRNTNWVASSLSALTTAAATAMVTQAITHHDAAATCTHKHPVNNQFTSIPYRLVRNARRLTVPSHLIRRRVVPQSLEGRRFAFHAQPPRRCVDIDDGLTHNVGAGHVQAENITPARGLDGTSERTYRHPERDGRRAQPAQASVLPDLERRRPDPRAAAQLCGPVLPSCRSLPPLSERAAFALRGFVHPSGSARQPDR